MFACTWYLLWCEYVNQVPISTQMSYRHNCSERRPAMIQCFLVIAQVVESDI